MMLYNCFSAKNEGEITQTQLYPSSQKFNSSLFSTNRILLIFFLPFLSSCFPLLTLLFAKFTCEPVHFLSNLKPTLPVPELKGICRCCSVVNAGMFSLKLPDEKQTLMWLCVMVIQRRHRSCQSFTYRSVSLPLGRILS